MLKIFGYFYLLFILTFSNESAAESIPPAQWVGDDFKGRPCSGEFFHYGPYDYTNPEHRKLKLPIVEEYHYTRETEHLLPETSGAYQGKVRIGGMQYTLAAFPNHHKALRGIAQYQLLFEDDIKRGIKDAPTTAVECYFERAIKFSPKDATTHIIYATYLKKIKHTELADKHYQKGISLAPDIMEFRYNYGLFLADQKKYSEALIQAKEVYEKKYPKQHLKEKLIKAGFWNE